MNKVAAPFTTALQVNPANVPLARGRPIIEAVTGNETVKQIYPTGTGLQYQFLFDNNSLCDISSLTIWAKFPVQKGNVDFVLNDMDGTNNNEFYSLLPGARQELLIQELEVKYNGAVIFTEPYMFEKHLLQTTARSTADLTEYRDLSQNLRRYAQSRLYWASTVNETSGNADNIAYGQRVMITDKAKYVPIHPYSYLQKIPSLPPGQIVINIKLTDVNKLIKRRTNLGDNAPVMHWNTDQLYAEVVVIEEESLIRHAFSLKSFEATHFDWKLDERIIGDNNIEYRHDVDIPIGTSIVALWVTSRNASARVPNYNALNSVPLTERITDYTLEVGSQKYEDDTEKYNFNEYLQYGYNEFLKLCIHSDAPNLFEERDWMVSPIYVRVLNNNARGMDTAPHDWKSQPTKASLKVKFHAAQVGHNLMIAYYAPQGFIATKTDNVYNVTSFLNIR